MRPRARDLVAAITLTTIGLTAMPISACGDSITSEPSPEVVETAESVARTVRFEAPFSSTPIPDDDEGPVTLDARVFGDGARGVILAHMRPADQSSWFEFATELAATGDFTALTFDFRGYGESTGDKRFDRVDTDVAAAYRYMREELGLDRIYLVGASMGGTAALIVASQVDASGVVSISSPAQFQELDAESAVAGIEEPKLFITSADDVPAARSLETFWELAAAPKEQHVYEGGEHGTELFAGEHAADLQRRLIAFLSAADDVGAVPE
jgi:pimeloyl-ACP methyl ester carboxylesterase